MGAIACALSPLTLVRALHPLALGHASGPRTFRRALLPLTSAGATSPNVDVDNRS